MQDYLDYGKLIDEAMHHVVRKTLQLVGEQGLPSDHHFFITFQTNYPGVALSEVLRSRYPDEMTIVVQHQFWDLEVEEDKFSIVLSFDNVKQLLVVPFGSLVSFADPSVKFGLQFQGDMLDDGFDDDDDDDGAPLPPSGRSSKEKDGDKGENISDGSNVVTLDNFRKK